MSRVRVIVGEPFDHAVGSILEGHQAGCGDDPGLAHPAADHLARPTCPGDECAIAHDDGTDRAGQAFGQAERCRRARGDKVASGHAERDRCVEQSRAVDEQRDTEVARNGRDIRHVGRRQRLAHRQCVGVLDRDECCRRLVDVFGVPRGRSDG